MCSSTSVDVAEGRPAVTQVSELSSIVGFCGPPLAEGPVVTATTAGRPQVEPARPVPLCPFTSMSRAPPTNVVEQTSVVSTTRFGTVACRTSATELVARGTVDSTAAIATAVARTALETHRMATCAHRKHPPSSLSVSLLDRSAGEPNEYCAAHYSQPQPSWSPSRRCGSEPTTRTGASPIALMSLQSRSGGGGGMQAPA